MLGNTLLEVAGVVLPLPSSLLILYSRELILYSILYSETHYSTPKVAGVAKNSYLKRIFRNHKKKKINK